MHCALCTVLHDAQGYYYYLREGDVGDPERYFIGGNDSLYRVKEYTGTWEDNEKHGSGILTYVNGDKLEGLFYHGQPHGLVQYQFFNGRTRYADYVRGERKNWMDIALERAREKAARLFKQLNSRAADEALLRELDSNTRLIKPPSKSKR
jgi:hypothetical protein